MTKALEIFVSALSRPAIEGLLDLLNREIEL